MFQNQLIFVTCVTFFNQGKGREEDITRQILLKAVINKLITKKCYQNILILYDILLPLHSQLKVGFYVCHSESELNYNLTITIW